MSTTILLTAEEAAAELRIARRRIWDLIRDGSLPSVKIGKSRRISREALHAYVSGLESAADGVPPGEAADGPTAA